MNKQVMHNHGFKARIIVLKAPGGTTTRLLKHEMGLFPSLVVALRMSLFVWGNGSEYKQCLVLVKL